MSQSTTLQETFFSSHASLAAIAMQLRSRGVFELIRTSVRIEQKTVKESPQDKLIDILMTLLCGGQSLVQINTLLRSDPGLQRSIGRERCCEQSGAQQTLDAATPKEVGQMQQVLMTLFRQYSQAASHTSRAGWFILDVDLTGMPCGKKAEKSVKGYFSQPRYRRGRQQARVLASQYGEIVVDELYPGNTILLNVLPGVMQKAEQVLNVIPWKRRHTIIRLDAGGGTIEAINQLLREDYAVVTKEYSSGRASRLVKSVKQWIDDPEHPNRQLGWVEEEALDSVRPVRRLAVRFQSSKGSCRSAVLLIAGLDAKDILTLMGQPLSADEATIMRAYAHVYDQRGGGVETRFGQDTGGLGITKRKKKRFEAQRLLMLLATLAHNLLTWSQRWLCQACPTVATRLRCYGRKRLVRDLYQVSGILSFDRNGRLRVITLQSSSSLAKLLLVPLQKLLTLSHIDVNLDQT